MKTINMKAVIDSLENKLEILNKAKMQLRLKNAILRKEEKPNDEELDILFNKEFDLGFAIDKLIDAIIAIKLLKD